MAQTKIEWTEASWNPVTGCTKISTGCANCYAERMAKRLQAMGNPNYKNGFKVTLHDHMLDAPLRMMRPRKIFVNSMSDLFHEDVPLEFIRKVFAVMQRASRHTFQILTKRSARLRELSPRLEWPENVWMGVTVEHSDLFYRINDLKKTDARIKFLSCEPLLGNLQDIQLDGIDWVIAGGESGPGARPMAPGWARALRDACEADAIPFFFKQWGGTNKKKAGRQLEGKLWNQWPRMGQVCLA